MGSRGAGLRAFKIDFLEPVDEIVVTAPEPAPRRSALDRAEVPASADCALPLRRYKRTRVALQAVVVIDRNRSFHVRTADISEGGILIEDYPGPRLEPGRLVGLAVNGVLSDADDTGDNVYLMQVVRHDGRTMALRFAR